MKHFCIAVMALTISVGAFGQGSESYVYGGIIVGVKQDAEIGNVDIDLSGTPISVLAGWQLSEDFSFEGRVGTWNDFCVESVCIDGNIDASILAKVGFYFNDLIYPYAAAGYSHTWLEFEGVKADEGDWGSLIGVAFLLSESLTINIEYSRSEEEIEGYDLESFNLSLGLTFRL
ncbi:MAG: outer membrane beta-barrel protein [Pseudohongiellaceae bacterium]